MSGDLFKYTYTDVGDGAIQGIATRFATTPDVIQTCSHGEAWLERTFEDARLWAGGGLDDGDVLYVPVRGAEWHLDDGAQWTEWGIMAGDTLQSILDGLKSGSPIGKLIPLRNDYGVTSSISVAATPLVSTLSMVWYYYRNRDLRRATLKSTNTKVETFNLFPTLRLDSSNAKTIWLPVIPPLTVDVPAAPSSLTNPQIGATVDVKPGDKLRRLMQKLSSIENQLDVIDLHRGDVLRIMGKGKQVCAYFTDLKESMEERVSAWGFAAQLAAANQQPDPDPSGGGKVARARALKKVDELIEAANLKIAGQPTWKQFLGEGENGVEAKIANATNLLKGDRLIANKEMMSLLVEVCPLMFAAPVKSRDGLKVTLLEYVCALAARAAVAIANSTEVSDWEMIWKIAGDHATTKFAGSACANIIEYACACANGFDAPNNPIAPTTAAHECLGVVLTLRMGRELDKLKEKASTAGGLVGAATTALKATFSKFMPLLRALNIADLDDEPEGIMKNLKDALELREATKEGLEGMLTALSFSDYQRGEREEFLEKLVHPGGGGDSLFAKWIPRGARSFLSVATVLWDVAGTTFEGSEAYNKSKAPDVASALGSSIDASMKLAEATSKTLEGAKALDLFAKEDLGVFGSRLAPFGEAAEATIKCLGRASFLLAAVSEGIQCYEAAERGHTTGAFGHALGATGSVCLFAATFTAGTVGGAVLITIGAVAVVGGVVLTKGQVAIEVFRGETVAKFKAITEKPDPDEPSEAYFLVRQWSTKLAFAGKLSEFGATFEGADFTAGSVALSTAAATGALGGPKF